MRAPTPLFDFRDPIAAGGFAPVLDRGGTSPCRASLAGGLLRFEGERPPGDAGPAAIRSAPAPFDLGGATGIALRLRGDGRRYALELRCDDGSAFEALFETATGGWEVILLPFDRFERAAPGPGALRPARVRTVGLRTADDRGGPFRLEVGAVAGYAPAQGVVVLPRPASP